MHFFNEKYSDAKNTGIGKKSWIEFGFNQLIEFHRFLGLEPDEEVIFNLKAHITYKEYKKGEYIAKQGELANFIQFQISGRHAYQIKEGGKERIVRLAVPGNIVGSVDAFLNGNPSDVSILCLDRSRVFHMDKEHFNKMLANGSIGLQYHILTGKVVGKYLHYQKQISDVLYASNTDKLKMLDTYFPILFEHFNLKHIAEFAGIKPETLSRLRAKLNEVEAKK